MTLTNKDIIANILETEEVRLGFISIFGLSAEIDKIAKQPKCGICRRIFFEKLTSIDNYITKLTEFFGEPVMINAPANTFHVETYTIKIDQWEEWFSVFTRGKKFILFNTFTSGDNVICSCHYIENMGVQQKNK